MYMNYEEIVDELKRVIQHEQDKEYDADTFNLGTMAKDCLQFIEKYTINTTPCNFCMYKDSSDHLYERTSWDGGIGFDDVQMNFCPKCGRDLREVNSEDI